MFFLSGAAAAVGWAAGAAVGWAAAGAFVGWAAGAAAGWLAPQAASSASTSMCAMTRRALRLGRGSFMHTSCRIGTAGRDTALNGAAPQWCAIVGNLVARLSIWLVCGEYSRFLGNVKRL